ncbi:LytTR family DNA-binding domain-containing protein [Alteromonadaceae bacterium BrNp21-10]|nr:LytTR family DNA-binding domain-containing protein [Alteromonadaceae bacterium BrNp21-10]
MKSVSCSLARLCWLICCLLPTYAMAQSVLSIDNQSIIVCEFSSATQSIPNFSAAECNTTNLFNVDPQGKEVWFKASINVSANYLQRAQPSALFVFGKMSSEVFFNGHALGNNGTPSFLADAEFAGNMDSRFYVPPEIIKQGTNDVVIHASAHHGLLTLAVPINFIGLAEYANPNAFFEQNLLVSLCLLGALLLGSAYLTTLVIQSANKKSSLYILLMALASSAQLFMEVSRTLFNYSYPFHDVRLLIITALAVAFGISFLAFSIDKFAKARQRHWFYAGVALTLAAVIILPGFDGKTALAILVPAIFSLVIVTLRYLKSRTLVLLAYLTAYALFPLTILLTFNAFHAIYFYYIVTAMMAFLIVSKANELVVEKSLRAAEEQQVLKLQFKLQQIQQQQTPSKLKITSAGKTELMPTQNIIYCKASGDYVELFLRDNKQVLFSGSLKSLEEQLPSTFVKVHRSFIVNLDDVTAITTLKNNNNSATLVLSSCDDIPISRRFLPQVREIVKQLG